MRAVKHCHTREDDCTENSDGKANGICAYQPAAPRWTCSYETCVG